jgi:MFS family permease
MVCQAFMATAAVLFALLVESGTVQVWHAYAYVLFIGVPLSITRPVRQALIANTVPREAFGNAYAANTFTIAGTRMIGPFFGGVVIAVFGFTWNFLVEAALYTTTILVLIPMKTPYRSEARAINQRSPLSSGARSAGRFISPLADLREGIRFICKEERAILNLMLLSLVPNVIMNPVLFLLPVFTSQALHRGADVGGYLLAATGFGALASAVTIASVGFIIKKGRVVLGSVVIGSVALILFAHAPWLIMTFALIILMSAALNAFRTSEGTLIQLLTPDRLRGRVTGLQAYGQGFVVFTSLLIGWFAGISSITIVITCVGGVSLALAIFSLLTSVRVRQLD